MNLKIITIFLLLIEYARSFNINDMVDSGWTGSLMFNNKEFELLTEAIEYNQKNFSVQKNNIENDDMEAENGGNIQNNPKISENIFLSSLIYNSEDDWVIWINDKKITSNEREKITINDFIELNILKVSGLSVSIELSIRKMNILSPNWRSKFIESEKSTLKSEKYDIIYDKERDKIRLNLKPNQSFILYNLEIIEGEGSIIKLSD